MTHREELTLRIKRGFATKLLLASVFLLLSAGSIFGQGPNVLSWRYDNLGQGQNTQETTLTPANVNTNTFGKLFSYSVAGQVYAQPLYVANVTLTNGTSHNVIYIADEHDQVYAFDADTNGGANSSALWQANLLSTAHGAGTGATTVPTADVQSGTGDIHPEIGITGTPVIDLNAGTIFVVAQSKENGNYFLRLHALSIVNGSERAGSPVAITASVPGTGNGSSGGTLALSPLWESNRPALEIFNGSVYIGFASHADNGPFHGWVVVYNESSLQQTAAICTSPNGYGDGIWMSGAGLPIDTVSANGRAFLVTGNGAFSSYPPLNNSVSYGESILRYDLTGGGFAISDAFTDFNQAALTNSDLDQASGGILMLPDQSGANPHLLLQIGKEGRILIIDRDNLGGYVGPNAGSNTNAVQDITGALGQDSGLWSTPAYWNGNVYVWAENDALKLFPLTNGVLATRATAQTSVSSAFPGASPVVSSNGTQSGIVWTVISDQYSSNGSSILYAFNAQNIGQELYASNQNSARDDAGPAVKFAVPVITHGKVYVGAGDQVDVYGLFNNQSPAPSPVMTPPGGTYSGAQSITISDTLSGAAIYYTTDGTTPTTGSTLYNGPISLSTNTTLQAIASGNGYLQSAVTTAAYTFNTQTPTPQFSPASGTYTTTQTVTITDSNGGAAIYYTTDGSTPGTNSTQYKGPIAVTSTATVNAIAVASGLTASNIATSTYTIVPNGTEINFGNGFANAVGLTLNGSATDVDDSRLQLTTGLTAQAGSAFYNTPTNIQAFTTDFAFQLSNAQADGFTFTMQNVGPTALGGTGGGLGYGPDPGTGTQASIAKSVAIKFDFFSNNGEGNDSTGLYVNGAVPTVPAIDMTSSGVLLNSGDSMTAHMTYDGTNLVMTITDGVVGKTFTHTFPIDIPGTIGSSTAYIGFTGGTGGLTSSQKILSWTLTSQAASVTQTPSFSPAGGTFPSAQQVTLSDGTSGAVIYYTVDGTAPTTASMVYSAPLTVDSGTVTIKALAQASGFNASSVGTATYTIQTAAAATPTFSPGTGTFTSAQSVTIADTTTGAVIHYTTDDSTPTTSSPVYGTAIQVSVSTTLKAIATASGFTQSAVGTAAYVIQTGGGSGNPNFASGFSSASGLQLNGVAKVNANSLEMTDGGTVEANSAFWTTPVNIQNFTTNFTFQLTNAQADGFTFTVQNTGLTALGGTGGGLGYGADPGAGTQASIGKSVAIKFDFFSNNGEGNDSTGMYLNGASPTVPAVDLTPSGIVLASGDTISAQLAYNGTTLTLNLSDTVTGKTFSQAFTVNIPSTVGANTAYVGFTGGSGGLSAVQNIKTWTFTPGSGTTPTAAEPTFSPAPGTYTSTQNVSLSSITSGATIYYTVDGSTPNHSSSVYAGPIVVSGTSLTIRAFSSATNYQDSPINVGAYQIQSAAATPTFTPAAGTYTSTQSVTIADTTTGAVIHYTTDNSTPTTSSPTYSAAIQVSTNTTVKAIATASGFTQSAVGTAAYVIQAGGGSGNPNFANGFSSASGLQLNGVAKVNANNLEMTDGGTVEANSAFWTTPVNIQNFTTNFTFQLTNAQADGFTFTVQNTGLTALGGTGGGLGYAADPGAGTQTSIGKSVAIKFDFFSNNGEGNDSTGMYLNGASPTVPAVDLTPSGIVLASGDTMSAQLSYNGTTLTLNLSDTVTGKTFSQAFTVNIPSTVGANTAYVGFTGGSGGLTAVQNIKTWTFTPGSGTTPTAGSPTFSPAPGTYTSTQNVSLSSTTAGATIYYTVDGSAPTHSSKVYSAPIAVAASLTIRALSSASGYQDSPIVSGAYQIQGAAATPTFTPTAGTYTTAQSVTIADTTTGAVIHYTTDNSTPTASSPTYSTAIQVSASSTLKAIATASGFTQSAVGTAAYVIQTGGGSGSPNFASGFASASGLQLNGVAKVNANSLEMTDGGTVEANSAFWTTPVNIQNFTTNFTFQLTNAQADGFTFTVQNAGLAALGGTGGGLGYAADPGAGTQTFIAKSVAIKFDFFSNNGEGNDSTGMYLNGASPTVPAVDLTPSGIVLASGDTMSAQLSYNGTTLTLNLSDTVTGKTFSQAFTVNIPSTVGANTAYVGFTGGSGGLTAVQNIKTWTFTPGP